MESLLAIAHYTIKQHIRHRIYLTVILFGIILMMGSVIISSLAVEQQLRMILDVGLGGIEFLALLMVLFVTVNLVLEEMESRSVYLVLSHPVERWQYIVGRFVGTMTALLSGIVIMVVMHVMILFLFGWSLEMFYVIAILCSMLKICVVGALALLVSLITTSTASAMTLTGFLWVLGHFTSEMKFMAQKSANPLVKALVDFLQYVTPNFSYFNYRDFWQASTLPPASWFGWLAIYASCYVGGGLFLTSWIFSKKEF